MRAPFFLLLATFGLFFLLPEPVLSQDEEHDDETPLAAAMTEISDALRGLRRSVRDPEKNPESLEAIILCQRRSIDCKVLAPAMAARMPEADRAEFVRDYRLEMIRFDRALLDFEQAILEGKDSDTLNELYKGLKGMEDPAHERFTEDG